MGSKKYLDEHLIYILKEFAKQLGKTPTYNQFEKESSLPSATLYKKRFGSWNNAIELAGLQSNAIRNFNKDDIVKEVLSFYNKHSRAPYYNEIKYSIVHVNNFWDGWTAMLEELNIPLNRRFSLVTDKEGLLTFLKELASELKTIPTGRDIEESGVNRNLFTQKFGSFKVALIKAGIVDEDYFKSMENRVPESIEAIKAFYNENQRAPTVDEYELIAKEWNLAHRKALEMILDKRFTEICMDNIGVANQYKRDKVELIEDLKKLKDKLGRTPMASELTTYGLAEKKQYYRTFKMTYNQLIESLGWELTSNKMHFKSIDELLDDYKKLYSELGRIPFFNDINRVEWMASSATYKKHFTDLPSIWRVLEIDVDNVVIEKSYGTGTACIDNNGEICRSYPEMIITNLLINLKVKYKKNVFYRELVPDLKSKIDADWLLIESNILIEYFGLFSEKQINEDNKIGRYSRKVLKKLDICKQNSIDIIDLYPEDLEDIEEILIKGLQNLGVIKP